MNMKIPFTCNVHPDFTPENNATVVGDISMAEQF